MVKLLALLGILLMTAPQNLSYGGKNGDTIAVNGGFTLSLTVTGPPALTRQLRASNVILGIQEIRIQGAGERVVGDTTPDGTAVQIRMDRAAVTGTFNSKPFNYDFTKAKPITPGAGDQLQQIAWALSMGGRSFRMAPKGEYTSGDDNDDAHGEAMGMIIDAPVRLPANAVDVGHEWKTNWTGERRQHDNGAAFAYQQVAKIEEIIGTHVRVSYTITGTLQIPAEKNTQREETTLTSKGLVLFDAVSHQPVSTEANGSIITELKAAGLKMARGITAKYETKR